MVPKSGTKQIASGSFVSTDDPSSLETSRQGAQRFGTKRVLCYSYPLWGANSFVSMASPKNSVSPRLSASRERSSLDGQLSREDGVVVQNSEFSTDEGCVSDQSTGCLLYTSDAADE